MSDMEIINLRRKRDFSEKLNVTFTFVRLNFRPLLLSIVLIAGPPVVVASLMMSSFYGEFFKMTLDAPLNPDAVQDMLLSSTFWLQFAVMFVFILVSYLSVTSVSYNFLRLYEEKKGMSIEVNEVWERVRNTLWSYLSTSLLFAFLLILAYVVMVLPAVVLTAIAPVLAVVGVLFFFVAVLYFTVATSLIFAVRAFEQIDFVEGILRCFRLISGKWWSTFGLIIVLSLIVGVTSYVFSIPAAILQGLEVMHSVEEDAEAGSGGGIMGVVIYVLQSLGYICQLLLYFLPCIGLAFQYFNLVELKESKGLMSDIGTLGQPRSRPEGEDQY